MISRFVKILPTLVLLSSLSARGALYTFTFNSGFANSGNIPDGDPNGWNDTRNLSGMLGQITDLEVKLNISGGYNGDLYAYLTHGNVLVPLLNRVGVTAGDPFGSADSGFSITLTASGSDIHWSSAGGGQVTGTYSADGRVISPLSPAPAFDTASRVALSAFDNLNPNGNWTLFIADLSGGGGQSVVNAWEVDIAAVPEPVKIALGCFLGIWLVAAARKRLHRQPMVVRES